MDVAAIAKVTFTLADQVREVVRNFNVDGFKGPPIVNGARVTTFVHRGAW